MFTTSITRPILLATRVLQWTSAVVVLGLTSYFLHAGPRDQHIIYQETIAAASAVAFLPAFLSPFMPNSLSKFVLLVDVVFSYLWLTGFIFSAQDFSEYDCFWLSPAGVSCDKKKANESFIFLTFVLTFIGMFLEVLSLWAYRQEAAAAPQADKADKEEKATDAPTEVPVEAATTNV